MILGGEIFVGGASNSSNLCVTRHFNPDSATINDDDISSTSILFDTFKQAGQQDQTVELHYISWACECANWATLRNIEKYRDGDELADHCLFVEPAKASLSLPDTIGYNGDIIQFTGQYHTEKGYPNDYVKSEQQVDKAKVFRFTSYKIIRSNYRKNLADQIDSAKYLVDKGALSEKTEILDVSYAAIMCTCPQWFETKYADDTFNIEQFYLESASDKIIAADELFDGINLPLRISVTGRFYTNKGYPTNYFPTKGDPEPAKVFRYNKIELLQNGNKMTQKNGL